MGLRLVVIPIHWSRSLPSSLIRHPESRAFLEFVEEDNNVGEKSYISNKTSFNFNKNKTISLGARKNLDKDITEYYNLIYEYKNDCLIAAIEYNKDFYSDENIKPDQNLFFSIRIIPFAEFKSPGVKKWL